MEKIVRLDAVFNKLGKKFGENFNGVVDTGEKNGLRKKNGAGFS